MALRIKRRDTARAVNYTAASMVALRALIRDHARLALVLLTLALAVKAVIPAGFMLSPGNDRFLTVTICSDASGTLKQMRLALPSKQDAGGDHSDMAGKGQPCAFSGLGQAGFGGVDPVLLVTAIAFILLIGLAPLLTPRARDIAFLRPPLRGPPASA